MGMVSGVSVCVAVCVSAFLFVRASLLWWLNFSGNRKVVGAGEGSISF